MFVSLSFDYRKCCNRSTATPSMPADPPLTLGTLAQISFLTKSCPTPIGCSKSPPRAGSTLKFCPTARGSTKGVVGCGLSRVLSEDDQCLATLLHPPHTTPQPPSTVPVPSSVADTPTHSSAHLYSAPKGQKERHVLFPPQLGPSFWRFWIDTCRCTGLPLQCCLRFPECLPPSC